MAQPSRAALLSIGDELLLGEIVDTNRPYIAQQLLALGITVVRAETVGDEIDEIAAAFTRALDCADVIVATGGLGPTADDLTLDALAKALGVELVFFEEVMTQMAVRLKRPVESLAGSNRKQALLPRGSIALRNDWGTAPGVHLPLGAKHIFLTAGVPREMRGLLSERILPILRAIYPAHQTVLIKSLHAWGIPESTVGERIAPLMQHGLNPNVGTRVAGGVVTVRLVAHGADESAARVALQPALDKVSEVLRDGLFGEDDQTLASAALAALRERGKTVALAESCTAGLASSLLGEVPGASAALMESDVVYSNAAKIRLCGVRPETLAAHGAVSLETAGELAVGIRMRAGVDVGVSVTGIAGPDGGTEAKPVGLVCFGVATERVVRTFERKYLGLDRNTVRLRAAHQALDFIRRAALGEY
ncbi:MAG TPA: competence/damage-inducible protein A [Planctomycetota bacterium]|nr:competence/damage-inducible protein A [Planctomycetota bacterium]